VTKTRDDRRVLLDAVSMRMREVTGLSVLYSQAMALRLGINSSDLECLDLVSLGSSDVTAGALAKSTGLTSGAITGVIDRLERAGFVKRLRNGADRRKVTVVASPTMRRQSPPLGAPMRKAIAGVLTRYSDDQLEFLHQALGELCEAAKAVIAVTHSDELLPPVRKPRGSRRRSKRSEHPMRG
jgi:DNA-binding MarR family transcriptional regulator